MRSSACGRLQRKLLNQHAKDLPVPPASVRAGRAAQYWVMRAGSSTAKVSPIHHLRDDLA
jgi:hypothetical protein